jgi:hypothetical protein|tara:strand:- start:2532 stop:2987 length:456 start_codon:yes stop_codon:yes gene_type:complete
MKLTLLVGRICSGKSSYKPDACRIVVSNIVKDIIKSSDRSELQNTIHLAKRISTAIDMVIDTAQNVFDDIVVDGIRQPEIVEDLMLSHPHADLVWLEVPEEERKRRYETRKDAKDTESFEIADNKAIELECQKIFSIFKDQLTVVHNYTQK